MLLEKMLLKNVVRTTIVKAFVFRTNVPIFFVRTSTVRTNIRTNNTILMTTVLTTMLLEQIYD